MTKGCKVLRILALALFAGRHGAAQVTGSPAIHATLIARLTDPDLIVEDLAFDAPRHRFLVTSVRRGGVYAIDEQGRVAPFVAPDTTTWGTFAVAIDSAHRALWVTTAAFPGTARYNRADSAHSQLLEYDLVTGVLRRRIVPPDAGGHALGDMTLATDGTLYLGDGFAGAVYVLDVGATKLRALVPPGTFRSAQTPALAADGHHLFIPDYSRGIAVVDLRDGTWSWLEHDDPLRLKGIDGLYQVDGRLIAVQNGADPNRILRLTLDATRIVKSELLATAPEATDLNHALPRNGDLYFISRSGWDRMSDDGRFTPGTAEQTTEIRRIRPE